MKQEEREEFFSRNDAGIIRGVTGMSVHQANAIQVAPASFTEGMEAHISDPVKPYQHIQASGYDPAGWKDPGNLPEGQEWCEDCGEGHPTENDPVNPGHYRSHPSGVECIQITEHMNFNLGNTIKYVWRAGLKTDDPAEDIKKALWYLRRELSRIEEES